MKQFVKTILPLVAILFSGACATTQNLHKNDPVLQKQLIGEYEYVKKQSNFTVNDPPIGSRYKWVLTEKKYDEIWNFSEIYMNGILNKEFDSLWMATPQGELILHEKPKVTRQSERAKTIYKIKTDGSFVAIGWVDANGKRNINSRNSHVHYTRILTPEERKVLREKIVGAYDVKIGENTIRAVFLENGIVESYKNGKRELPDDKWKIENTEIHALPTKSAGKNIPIMVFRINNDGSLTIIAEIHEDGKRYDRGKSNHLDFKKIK